MAPAKKSVLITGCSAGGIGAGLAEAFQQKGYHVFLTLRNLSKTPANLANETNITVLQLDVLSAESITAAVENVSKATSGRLDILINNSGQNLVLPALDTTVEDARKIFDLNFFAPLAMIQAFIPLLVKAQGYVVNQSSAAGCMSMPFLSRPLLYFFPSFFQYLIHNAGIYSSSKAAMIAGSDIWRRELEPLGVRSMTLVTTSVKTPAFENVTMPKVPENSYYYVIRDYVARLGSGVLQEGAPDPVTYGHSVVKAIEAGKIGEVWVGKDASMNHWSWKLLPKSMFDSVLDGFLKVSGELAKVAQAAKKAK
ncbi:short-chain dehydrogenase/reductase [Xylariaceae sp. FL1651]|nr:short-chain dehydrogenase/reductase [Xylariaceae sp. FL1651]